MVYHDLGMLGAYKQTLFYFVFLSLSLPIWALQACIGSFRH